MLLHFRPILSIHGGGNLHVHEDTEGTEEPFSIYGLSRMAKIRRKRAGISFSISVTVFILRLIKQQSVVTHTIRQTETPALPDSWATNTSSVKMLCQKKKKIFP